jgi:hypothetical protein
MTEDLRQLVWSRAASTCECLTPVGRTTIVVLRINLRDRIEHRRLLIAAGLLRVGQA